jgi:hypothetical protein
MKNYKENYNIETQEVASVWNWHGRIFYDHEVVDLDHIPDEGGAVIVYYHGVIPVDYLLLVSKIILGTPASITT